jgi:hypothetical protein
MIDGIVQKKHLARLDQHVHCGEETGADDDVYSFREHPADRFEQRADGNEAD